ncbi:MAG: protein kinase [Acidobacteriaceae bacterium]|nr:protein kinase [Acidobacteriaceae bacterium]
MLTCPVCDTLNEDGSVSCEHCNCALQIDAGETILSKNGPDDQQTVVATEPSGAAPTARVRSRPAGSEVPIGIVLIGRYEILARLGQGGMGTVYKALDRELDRVIALKTIRPDLASNTAALRRLKQETLLARQIAHRNVIRVFDLGVADKLRFITMEFVEGHDLKALLDPVKKLSTEDAVEILTQICQGLQAAHSEDVVHRDLKPQNVLLSAGNRVRIVDFGLARSFENTGITHSGVILGTPAYMAPEQALGQQGDARADIFSLGVIAFELLTGELPFPSHSLSESLLSRTRGRARAIEYANPEVPAWLARIVMRCLERNPADRYETAQAVASDLLARDVCPYLPPGLRPDSLAPGTMVGSRYRIEAEAGEGGMGKVYRATDLDLHRTVALKVVRPDLVSSSQSLDQLIREISIASQISHKNVLRIHDLGEASGLRFVSMAWAEGEDLGHVLKRSGPLPEERIFELGCEICEGLEAAHEQGITHRDLKPSNILLTSGGHACIADFGLAHSLDSAALSAVKVPEPSSSGSQSGSVSGTPRYMSPEQVEGAPTIDHRTDIYSLGLILYEMATGRIPFNDDSVFQTMTQRLTEKPVSPKLLNPAISDKLAAITMRCLEREPKERYASVHELLVDLRRKPEPTLAPPGEIRKKASRLKRAWLPASLAVLVLLAGAGWFWQWRTPRVEPPANGKYIAVLPFRTIGSDPNLKYRAEGIADSISARLSSLASLHPISASALERVNFSQPEESIGKQLGANLLVNGIVQSEGDEIKVDVSIYNTEKHHTMWSKSYRGAIADLFTLEEDISNDTEDALNVKPTNEERERQAPAPTQNLAAYDLYLKGRDILKNHRDESNVEEALGLFEQACKQDDSFALAWTGVADASLQLYRVTGNTLAASKALAAAEEARRRNNNLPEVHFALGSVYTATGRNAEAVSEIRRALQLAPNSDDGYIRLGKAYLATGQKEEGLKALKKAVDLNPYYWRNHNQLGAAFYRVGRTEDALREFKEEIAQNPTNQDGYNNVGTIYLAEGQWKKSIPEFEKAIKIRPSSFEFSNLATAYFQLGRYKEAIPVYQQALALDPNQADVVRNLAEAYTQTGQQAKATETYDRATALFYEQLGVNPQNAYALSGLALCYAARKNTAKARQLIHQARAIDGADSNLMYDEAVVLALDGRIPEALKALGNALENGLPFNYCLGDPDLKAVRDSPGFNALKKKFGRR